MIDKRRQRTASTSGGLSVSKATKRRWTRSSLACWHLNARMERPVRPLSAAMHMMGVVTLGGRGTWAGIRGVITVGPKIFSTLGYKRGLEGGVEGTVARLEVDADMSAAKARMDG